MKQSEIKNLLILTPGFPADEHDTTCLPAVQQFVLCYKKIFPDTAIHIISLHYPHYRAVYSWQGISVYALGGKSKGGFTTVKILFSSVRVALKLNREKSFDAVLSLWLADTALAGKIISSRIKLPHLIWMHGQDAKPGNPYFKRVRPNPGNLAAISEYQNNIFYRAYGIKARHVINNGIRPEIFPVLNKGHRDIDIFAAGNLIPLKKYHLLVELVYNLKHKGFPRIKAVIAGEGILKDELESLIKENHLENNIRLLGKIPHPEVLKYMNHSRIFVHPSAYEGHSTVMLEALFSGCSVLSFIPVSPGEVKHFFLCKNPGDMLIKAGTLLQESIMPERIICYDMQNSVRQINSVLSSL